MDDFDLNSKYKRYRKRKDAFKNTVLEFVVHEPCAEKETHFLNFSSAPSDNKFDFKKEANRLVKRLAKEGAFSSFSVSEQKNAELNGKLPKGFQVDFIIPPAVGGKYSFDNLYVVPKEVSLLMYQLYWRQVIPEFKAFINKKEPHRFGVQFPKIPKLFFRRHFLNFIPNYEKQDIVKYLERKEKWRKNALNHVLVNSNKRTIVLRALKRKDVPSGMKYALLKISSLSSMERAKRRQEYLHVRPDLVRSSLKRGDFQHLPTKTQDIILRTGHVPDSADLTCHHVLPRALGGENGLDNICWLSKNDHMRLHRGYIDPLIEYLDGLFDEKRSIFIEIPVPVNTKMPLFTLSKQGLVIKSRAATPVLKRLIRRGKINKIR